MGEVNGHSRRLFLKQAGVAAIAGLAASRAWGAGAVSQRPNVLFIAVDDLKPLLGCYGVRQIQTPHIDALARRGMVFEHAYCQQALCSPSRTSLLTGRRPDTTRIYDLQTHFRKTIPDVVTLPQQFAASGYRTQSLSKIYHPGLDDPKSWTEPSWFPRGPEYQKREDIAEMRRERQEAIRLQHLTRQEAAKKIRGVPWEAPDVPDEALPDGRTAAHAIEVLRELKQGNGGRPFFLATGFLKPHLPFVAPKKYFDLYPLDSIRLADNPRPPKDVPPVAMSNWGELRAYHGMPGRGPVTDEQARELIRGYYAAASFCDAMVGRVLDELDRLDLRRSTVIALWGDHGWHLGDHGLWCKHTDFESATHAPLIVSAPGMKHAGGRTPGLVEFVDIYPSLCELCGVPLPAGLEGSSFVPLLEQPERAWKKAAFSQYPRGRFMGYTLATQRYRYTEWLHRQNHDLPPVGVELYDHQVDPQENVNLAGHADSRELVAGLRRMLRSGWRGALPAMARG